MVDIPFSWSIDLELSRVRTLYGNGENPVLPYEPPSTVIKISKFNLGNVSGTRWLLQFEHTKIYDPSFYGQEERAVLLLERDENDGIVEVEGSVSMYDMTTHKRLCKTEFNSKLEEGDLVLPIYLPLSMCDFSHVVFENSKLIVQGNVAITPHETTSDDDDDGDANSEVASVTSSEIHIIKNNPLVQLSYNLASLLEEGTFSDVNIKCDGVEIPAHKNIMSARSPIFAAMFKSNMAEGNGNELVITDVKPPVLQKMLMFLYSSQVKDLDFEMACDLLIVSDKYEISGLVEICVEYLKSNLTSENALEMLLVADMYDKGLKNYVSDYISCFFSYFETTNEWKDMTKNYPALVIEVLMRVVKLKQSKTEN